VDITPAGDVRYRHLINEVKVNQTVEEDIIAGECRISKSWDIVIPAVLKRESSGPLTHHFWIPDKKLRE
jgi:hypothetical protein